MAEDGIFNFRVASKSYDSSDEDQGFDLRIATLFKETSLDPLKGMADDGPLPEGDAPLLADYVPGDEFWF